MKTSSATNCEHFDQPNYSRGLCRKCYRQQYYQKNKKEMKKRSKAYQKSHPQSYNKKAQMWYRHKMLWTEYQDRLAKQKNSCICGHIFNNTWNDTARIDHDPACCPAGGRSCGKCTRGLLCNRCNRVLGLLEKDPQLLPKYLVDYLAE